MLFDRSWYNRAGVERVMGFCTPNDYLEFMRQCPEFERMLVRSGIALFKYWFSVSREEQRRRFAARETDPLEAMEALADRPRLDGQMGRLHRGEGGDVLLHRHRGRAVDDRQVRRQEAGAAELHAALSGRRCRIRRRTAVIVTGPDPLIVGTTAHVIGTDMHIIDKTVHPALKRGRNGEGG